MSQSVMLLILHANTESTVRTSIEFDCYSLETSFNRTAYQYLKNVCPVNVSECAEKLTIQEMI